MGMNSKEMMETAGQVIMNTYGGRYGLALVRGEGAKVYDPEGNEYLDFVGGLAVIALGHAHPAVAAAVAEQAAKLVHVSNLFYTEPQIQLARLLTENSFADQVFFCNSGAEANEAAIKLARKYFFDKHGPGRHKVVTMKDSFHGRTMATLAATAHPKFRHGFEPVLTGFSYVPFGDVAALAEAINDDTCAVMLEPIQGEGGVNEVTGQYLKEVSDLCKSKGVLLIFDEVQVGMGRTGKLFAYEHFGVAPDIMTLAKALANGLPIGAALAGREVAQSFSPGTHATTFGGTPLVTAAAKVVIETMIAPGFLDQVARVGGYFKDRLKALAEKYDFIREVRGLGLIIGLDLSFPGAGAREEMQKRGFLINCTQDTVLRFLPPPDHHRSGSGPVDPGAGRSLKRRSRQARGVMSKRDFLTISDLSRDEVSALLKRAAEMKARRREERTNGPCPLAGKTLGMVFNKPSTRTRVSFEVGVYELGGRMVFIEKDDTQISRREPLTHYARVLSRYLDGLIVRTFSHQELAELATWADMPVINALTDDYHPCQVLADLLTVVERQGSLDGIKAAWVGDGNNVAHSWLTAAALMGFELALAVPEGYEPNPKILAEAQARAAKPITVSHDPMEAVSGADVINTDVWTSMGQEDQAAARAEIFRPFQVNAALVARAKSNSIVLHCLPAHLGDEITEEVVEGPHSAVFDQAENRLHAQKALMEMIVGD